MHFIGDVHGKFIQYEDIIRHLKETIVVGDFGIGFINHKTRLTGTSTYTEPPRRLMKMCGNHRYIRGNHDNPAVCREDEHWIPDGHVEGDMMFIGGALSIDKDRRREGYDYWRDEELTYADFSRLLEVYEQVRPRIMVTHDCPELAALKLFDFYHKDFPSITRQGLDMMFEIHQPEYHIFGHWHVHRNEKIYGTRFICLKELQIMEL